MKHEEFFRKHPVFTVKEFRRHMSSHGNVGERAAESILAYYRNSGRIVKVRRGLYAVIRAGNFDNTYPIDLFLVASKLTPDAVLSHHTALEFYGKAYSVHSRFIYSATRPPRAFTFLSHVFQGTKFPQALIRAGKEHMEVSTKERAGLNLRITNLERIVVDVMDRPDLSGSWEEIWRSLESVEFFDLDRVVEYAFMLGNRTTAAKVGFFLEQHRETLMVEDRYLKALQELRPRQPHYLDRTKRHSGRFVSRWNLVVPSTVIERKWGEVL